MIRVTTVIPVYNRKDLVKRSIESAISQGIDGHEILLMDNCSTDGTWEVLKEYSRRDTRVRCVRNECNIGPVKNWKRGVEIARGEYCHLLFSDDTVEPGFLGKVLPLFDSQTGYVITGHVKCQDGREVGRSTFQERREISRGELLRAVVFDNPERIQLINPVGAVFRRVDLVSAIFPEIENPFGIDFNSHGAGPDMLILAIVGSRYDRIRCVDEHLAVMHSHAGSITVQSSDLRFPREWARWYFVREYWPQERERYLASLWVKSWRTRSLRPLVREVRRSLFVGAGLRLRWVLWYLVLRMRGRR
jgi:glycosyltransferase involved in cell wall biosynthesis